MKGKEMDTDNDTIPTDQQLDSIDVPSQTGETVGQWRARRDQEGRLEG